MILFRKPVHFSGSCSIAAYMGKSVALTSAVEPGFLDSFRRGRHNPLRARGFARFHERD
jgi:hypothetical protein